MFSLIVFSMSKLSLFTRTPDIGLGNSPYSSMSSSKLIISSKTLLPNKSQSEVLGVRISTYKFGEDIIQPITGFFYDFFCGVSIFWFSCEPWISHHALLGLLRDHGKVSHATVESESQVVRF